jgi:DNA-directed RNA polymerase specialized sigma24 family protein
MRRRGASQNLYRRLSELLRDEPFVLIHDSTKSQNRVYALAADKSPFSGREQELLSLAWSLGDFTPIRYRASARKTTPVLSTEDLQRFVTGLMAEADGGLSLGQIVVVLSKRFDLDEAGTTDLESATTAAEMDSAFDALALKETANALIDDLTERQRIVLCRRGAGATIPEIARELQCSPATVFNDETRIGQVITEESADNEERDELLKFLIDLLCS